MKITIDSNKGTFYNGQAGCFTRLMLLMIAVMIGAWLLPGVDVTSWGAVLLTAIVISVLNNIIRPILIVMASELVKGFHVDSFGSALLFSLVLMAVNYLLELPNKLLNRKPLRQRKTRIHDDDTDDEGFTPYEEIEN